MELIDKAAVVAEIKKLKSKIDELSSYGHGWHDALRMLEAQIDTLEMKEVDVEKECEDLRDDGICNFATNKTGEATLNKEDEEMIDAIINDVNTL